MQNQICILLILFLQLITKSSAEEFEKPLNKTPISHKILYATFDVYNFFSDTILRYDCDHWYRNDPGPPTDLIPCPPTPAQSRCDLRFEIDPSCRSPPCAFHPRADFCVRSRVPSPSGSGQQCCYKDGRLFRGPPGGGTVDKSHYKTNVGLNHFQDDVLPWSLCCKGKPLELCKLYYEKRPSDSGESYVPPSEGSIGMSSSSSTVDLLKEEF